ncbi:MAG: hypothetical protein Q7S68_01255, partial [Deltaproteobacteria bacterium]|nr:hypothetical protein [Deltaproteobacteria bacterium]
ERRRVLWNKKEETYETLIQTQLPKDQRQLPDAETYANPPKADWPALQQRLAEDEYQVCRSEDRLWAYKENVALANPCNSLTNSNFRELTGVAMTYPKVVEFVNAAHLGNEDWCYGDLSAGLVRVTNDALKKERALSNISSAELAVISEEELDAIKTIWTFVSSEEEELKPMSTATMIGAFTLSGVLGGLLTPVVGAYLFNASARNQINQFVRTAVTGLGHWFGGAGRGASSLFTPRALLTAGLQTIKPRPFLLGWGGIVALTAGVVLGGLLLWRLREEG